MTRGFTNLLLFIFFCSLLWSCSTPKGLVRLEKEQYPVFTDSYTRESLLTAIDNQIHYLRGTNRKNEPAGNLLPLNNLSYIESLESFRTLILLHPFPLELNRMIREHYTVYQSEGRDGQDNDDILLTGYYEPLFHGSIIRDKQFRFPLYAVPKSLIQTKDRNGKKTIGRYDDSGDIKPYWSRSEIESGELLVGSELVYLKDPLDAYLMHVQGSGRILLQDGSIRPLHFSNSNGLTYNSLGKLFVDEGHLAKEDVSIPAIRSYFSAHPDQITRMLHHNPRYIFFKWGEPDGPRGSIGEVLTPGRSVAVDHSRIPSGSIGYIISRKPVLDSRNQIDHWKPFTRFVLFQDSGAAIKGAGRADLFLGSGKYAETTASHMNESGKLFILIQNSFELPEKIK